MRGVKRKIRCGGKPVTVIVLAGGRGRRMNADKARLPVRGETLLERVLGQVAPYFDEVLVSISPGQRVHIEGPGLRFVEDEVPNLGPLGGILAGLRAAANDVCAVVACDIPDIHIPLLRGLVTAAGKAEIAVTISPEGQFEPLFAVYSRAIIPKIEALIQAGDRSLIPLFRRCRTVVLRLHDTSWLQNLNTRKDYEAYLASLQSK